MARVRALYLLCVCLSLAGAGQAQTSYLDNGSLRVGVDLASGGAINYLSLSGSSTSLVNIHDPGRFIQQSYYSGPTPFIPTGAVQHPAYAGWGWNPVQAGDVYGNLSQVLAESNDGATIYVKSIPQQWALNNVPAACTFETWVTLDANRVRVRNRLVNSRPDTVLYQAFQQELPALYTVGALSNLFTYTGPDPFSGGNLTQIRNSGPPWEYWHSTEQWSALVDNANFGIGVHTPGAVLTVGGFHGSPGWGGPTSDNTGYLAPLQADILDHDIVYEFSYTLIVGDLYDDIRNYAYSQARPPGPHLIFVRDRQHCLPAHLTSDAPPFAGFWPLHLTAADPSVVLAPFSWDAADVPRITIRAAYRTQNDQAEIFFAGPDGVFTGAQRLTFTVIPDGVVRAYEVDLASHALYSGPITGLRFDPIVSQTAGDEVDLYGIGLSALSDVPLTSLKGPLDNYPNPFNPRTSIRYILARESRVDLQILNAAGQRVRTLKAGQSEGAGTHEIVWDGRNEVGAAVASGAYFARLETAARVSTVKMLLVR